MTKQRREERAAQGQDRVEGVGVPVDARDRRAALDTDARDDLADLETGRVGDGDGGVALIPATETSRDERARTRRDNAAIRVAGAAQDDVSLVEDGPAGVGVAGGRERGGVIDEVIGARGVRIVEQEAHGATGVVDHIGADGQLATRGAAGGVTELVDVEVATYARRARGEVTVAGEEVTTVGVLGEHEATAAERQGLAAQAQGLGA